MKSAGLSSKTVWVALSMATVFEEGMVCTISAATASDNISDCIPLNIIVGQVIVCMESDRSIGFIFDPVFL